MARVASVLVAMTGVVSAEDVKFSDNMIFKMALAKASSDIAGDGDKTCSFNSDDGCFQFAARNERACEAFAAEMRFLCKNVHKQNPEVCDKITASAESCASHGKPYCCEGNKAGATRDFGNEVFVNETGCAACADLQKKLGNDVSRTGLCGTEKALPVLGQVCPHVATVAAEGVKLSNSLLVKMALAKAPFDTASDGQSACSINLDDDCFQFGAPGEVECKAFAAEMRMICKMHTEKKEDCDKIVASTETCASHGKPYCCEGNKPGATRDFGSEFFVNETGCATCAELQKELGNDVSRTGLCGTDKSPPVFGEVCPHVTSVVV